MSFVRWALHIDPARPDLGLSLWREVDLPRSINRNERRFTMDEKTASEIAKLNDAFRRSGQNVIITPGVMFLPCTLKLLNAVLDFDTFTEDNDPYGEHDFGSLKWRGATIFWKIDYYDQMMQHWEDPVSPKCKRVMTVMLADEY
jgi:hypothetical protein